MGNLFYVIAVILYVIVVILINTWAIGSIGYRVGGYHSHSSYD